MANNQDTSNRGFASMDEDKQRDIASKGGQSVPDEKRSFSQDRELAAEAGRKGGQSVPDEKRSFSQDRQLAAGPQGRLGLAWRAAAGVRQRRLPAGRQRFGARRQRQLRQ